MSVLIMVLAGSAAVAGSLEKGDNEIFGSFSYTDMSVDGASVDVTMTQLSASYGRMFTDSIEAGGSLTYFDIDLDGPSADGGIFEPFFQFNFGGGDKTNPYLGARYLFFFGDQGDLFSDGYGLEGGLKYWPWDNAGFDFGVKYQVWSFDFGSEEMDVLSANAGIRIKF
jgi:hypothetical protein